MELLDQYISNADLNSGTSIYRLKDNHNFKKDGEHILKLKKDLYLINNVDTKE